MAAAGRGHHRRGGTFVCAGAHQLGFALPAVLTAVYAFLTIRFEDTSIRDFLVYACAFLLVKQQRYEWRLTPHA